MTQSELLAQFTRFELRKKFEEYLIFGSYPEVLVYSNRRHIIESLHQIANSYMLKDILSFD